jgi:hypothetical protein
MVTDLFSIFYAVLLLMGSFAECHIKVGSTCTLRGPSFLYRSREGFHGCPVHCSLFAPLMKMSFIQKSDVIHQYEHNCILLG